MSAGEDLIYTGVKIMHRREKRLFLRYDEWIVILFFVLFFLFGCLTYKDYGISSDEAVQRRHSLVTYNELFLKDQVYQTPTVDTEALPPLKEYGINYGVILQLPLVFIEHLNHFEMTYQEIYTVRHLYNFCWFFVSSVFFYHIALIFTGGRRREALIGTIIYVLCPRTLADSFYNIKDSLCLSLFTISIYYGIRLIQKLSIKNVLLFVVFSALCASSRIVGGVVVAACLSVIVIKSFQEKTWKKLLAYGALTGGLFLGAFILLSPNAWENIPQTLMKIVRTFSNYTLWDADVLYMGQWIHGSKLPWHYLFVWIGTTVPATYLFFMFIGLGGAGRYCIRQKKSVRSEKKWLYLFLYLILIIPFAYVIIVRPVLYNGWRHFYFMYSVIACWAVVGLHMFLKADLKHVLKVSGLTVLGAVLVYLSLWIIKNHPYGYVYYNPWIRWYAEDHFQRDYWYVSETNAFKYILEECNEEYINVFAHQGYTWFFDSEEGNPFHIVSSREVADYVVGDENDFEESYLYTREKDIRAGGMVIRSIYNRIYDITRAFQLVIGRESAEYELNGIRWRDESSPTEKIYIGELNETIAADLVAAVVSDNTLLEEGKLEVSVSDDGINWHNLRNCPKYSEYDTRISAECVVYEFDYIKITYDKAYEDEAWVRLVLCEYRQKNFRSRRNPTVAEIESNVERASDLYAMVDGNMGTRWESSRQQEGMYVEVTLDDVYLLSGAKLETEESPWDYPRNLKISVSNDKENWVELQVSTSDNQTYAFSPVECRYLKLELGKTEENVSSNWSIYELRLFTVME